jgi:hypothetical protein
LKKSKRQKGPVGYWPSHSPFHEMIDFSVHGNAPAPFIASRADDHVAELCGLMQRDVYDFWRTKVATPEGVAVRKIVDSLSDRIRTERDLLAAETLWSIATYAAFEVMDLYLRNRQLFDKISSRRALLPSLMSIHPNTAKVMARMSKDARLGSLTFESRQIGSKAWFTSNIPANVYARAIITSVEFNQNLEPLETQQKRWKSFDRQHRVTTRVLPFPNYIEGIDEIPFPISPECVPDYWRKGKEIMLEEMPDFHERPEWKNYGERHYANGAKRGAIRHAIFKDILIALRTIAGGNRAAKKRTSRTSNDIAG